MPEKKSEDYSIIRCTQHDDKINHNKGDIDNIWIILRGDKNGEKGMILRFASMESKINDILNKEKVRASIMRAFYLALAVQLLIIVYKDFLKPLIKVAAQQ